VITGPGEEETAAAARRGRLRVSHDDREQIIDTLKVAFVQDRLTKDEFDARISQTLAARTYADLTTVTADIPPGLAGARPRRKQARRKMTNAARWGAAGIATPAILSIAFAVDSMRGGSGLGAVTIVIAFLYFVFWLSAGVDMLWQWHCMTLPKAGMCVRCAHTAASHRSPASCTVRPGGLKLNRCPCAGYVPPGVSPESDDLRLLPSGCL
jgi:hypothetical protein